MKKLKVLGLQCKGRNINYVLLLKKGNSTFHCLAI